VKGLRGVWRVLLWDFERGGLAYDLLIVLMAAVVFLVPESVWHDPLRRPTR
jgi:hypothetical protein